MSGNKNILSMVCRSSTVLSLKCNKYRLFNNTKQPVTYFAEKLSTKVTAKEKFDWNQAVSEAEKVVGYPTSFLSLRWLLSDEVANVALHLQKLVGTNHPLLKTAKSIIYNEHHQMQTWGLIVLLISKAAGQINQANDVGEEKAAGVMQRQRALAEITEMMRTAHLIHKGLVNMRRDEYTTPSERHNMIFGNKIALLSGDYLLGISCAKLSSIKNHALLELMSVALRDLAESAFLGRRDNQNNPLPSVPPADTTDHSIKEWTRMNFLNSASLLGKSCKGAVLLGGHDEDVQKQAYDFGENLAHAWQASYDLSLFTDKDPSVPFSLCSAPVMFHVDYDPTILTEIDKGLESVNNVNYAKIYEIVTSGPGIERTKQLQQEHSQRAMEILHVFEDSDARMALSNIVASIGNY